MNIIKNNIDKLLHFCVSFVIFMSLLVIFELPVSAVLTILIGIGKEFYDYDDYGKFSNGDIIADTCGIFYGILICTLCII